MMCAQGNGRVTCPLHVHLVESEPIIPVPEPEHYDDETDDGGGGRHGHGNDRDAPSEETHLDVSAPPPHSFFSTQIHLMLRQCFAKSATIRTCALPKRFWSGSCSFVQKYWSELLRTQAAALGHQLKDSYCSCVFLTA